MDEYKKKKYVIMGFSSAYYMQAYKDVIDVEYCDYIPNAIDSNNRFLLGLYRLNFSRILNSIIKLPKFKVWNMLTYNNLWQCAPDYFIIFHGRMDNYIDTGFVEYLRNVYPNAKIVVFCQDLVDANNRKYNIEYIQKKVDLVLSFDQGDVEKYDLVFYPDVYSNILSSSSCDIQNDLSFVGKAKNRLELILQTWEYCNMHGVSCDFHIVGVPSDKQKSGKGIYYHDEISYSKYLDILRNSNCVLEIIQKNGRGSTLRLAESVMCNRKLLTNSKDVNNHEAYKYGYIKQFDSVQDIDIDFIKKRETIDYSSIKESFSPLELLKFIDSYFNFGDK